MTQTAYTRTRITVPMSDMDVVENCHGKLLRGPCRYGRAARSVEGTPALSVVDARVREAPGASLEFSVMLDQAASGPVTVDYATSDGTAEAGADYVAANGTLSFAAGETAKTVAVSVLDDAHEEGAETLTLRLSNASGARIAHGRATGTIANGDPLPEAWLARFGRTAAGHVADGVQARLAAPRMAGVQATLAGQSFGQTAPGGGLMCDAPSGARPTAGDGLATRSAWDDALLTEEAGSERRSGSQSLAGRGLPAEIAFAVFVSGGPALARIVNSVTDTDYSGRTCLETDLRLDADDSFRRGSTEVGWAISAGFGLPLGAPIRRFVSELRQRDLSREPVRQQFMRARRRHDGLPLHRQEQAGRRPPGDHLSVRRIGHAGAGGCGAVHGVQNSLEARNGIPCREQSELTGLCTI